MKVVLVTSEDLEGASLGTDTLAEALAREGHVPVVVAGKNNRSAETPAGIRLHVARQRDGGSRYALEAAIAFAAARAALSERPDAAVVVARNGFFAVPAILFALRIPVILLVPRRLFDDAKDAGAGPVALELMRQGLVMAARTASAIVTLDPEVPSHLETEVGLRGVAVLGGGHLELAQLPFGPCEDARRTIGLEPSQRFSVLTGPLDASVRADLLALAHRKVAGLGLLVIGTGPQDALISALSASTRPSSPVLHVPTLDVEARRIAIQAADIALCLSETGLSEDALWAAALGRRVVALDGPGTDRLEALYPGLEAVIRVKERTADGLRQGIEAGLAIQGNRGPLPDAAIEAARRTLSRGRPIDQLIEVLAGCASSC